MSSPPPAERSSNSTPAPSPALIAAAVAGLLCASVACGSDDEKKTSASASTDAPHVTASRVEPDMTLDEFTAACTTQNGHVEMHATCGGVNSCRGFSYDTTTLEFTEHTCKALNTCAGYSCVLEST